MVWCGAGFQERSPDHLLAVLVEEGALMEVVMHEAFQRIQQVIGSELNPAVVHAEVIKEHWTLDQGVLHARTSPAGET
jgi:hypothetical protein